MRQQLTSIRTGICLFSDRGKWYECHRVCIYFWNLGNDILAHGNLNRGTHTTECFKMGQK